MGANSKYMQLKNKSVFLALCLILLASFLFAQNQEVGGATNITKTKKGFLITQSITFPPVPDVMRYEVEIEQRTGTQFIPGEQIQTQDNTIELHLKAGIYRYRYSAYNIMNLLEGQSQWVTFEVRPAIEPQVESFQPFYALYFEMLDPTSILTINGDYFYYDSEFALLEYKDKTDWSNIDLGGKGVIYPDSVEVIEDHAFLTFSNNKLRKGMYKIFIRNPGGLWSVFGQVKVGFWKKTAGYYGFGYAPLIPAYNYHNEYYEDDHGDKGIELLNAFNSGFYLNFGLFLKRSGKLSFGLDFSGNFVEDNSGKNAWGNDYDENFRSFMSIRAATFNWFFQKPSTERWYNNYYFGGGVSFTQNYHSEDSTLQEGMWPISLNVGYHAQYFFWKNLFVKAGVDFRFVTGLNIFYFFPSVGLGIQPARWPEYAEVKENLRRGEDVSVPVDGEPKKETLFSIGWAPMVPMGAIGRYSVNSSTGEPGDELLAPFNAGGFSLRFAGFPLRWKKSKIGVELELSVLVHKNWEKLDLGWWNWTNNLSDAGLLILYQWEFANAFQLNFNGGLGAGQSYVYTYELSYDSITDSYTRENHITNPALTLKVGTSLQWFFVRNMYLEACLDFSIRTDKIDNWYGKYGGFMKPGIRVGWQRYRDANRGLQLSGNGFQELRPK